MTDFQKQVRWAKRQAPQHGRFETDYCVVWCVVRKALHRENAKLKPRVESQ